MAPRLAERDRWSRPPVFVSRVLQAELALSCTHRDSRVSSMKLPLRRLVTTAVTTPRIRGHGSSLLIVGIRRGKSLPSCSFFNHKRMLPQMLAGWIVRPMRALGLVVVFCTCFPPGAAAQAGGRWLIVPTTTGSDGSWVEPAASNVRAELAERGVDVWSLDDAATWFEAKGSAPPARVTEGEIQEWIARSNAAVEDLVKGAPSRALDQLNEAQEFSRGAVEALNREARQSQRLFDTCLYARARLAGNRLSARAEARATRVSAARSHRRAWRTDAPSRRVEGSRRSRRGSDRADRSAHGKQRASGCTARVNGVPMGETPLEVSHLFPGQYRVQVECEPNRPGRFHTADVKSELTEVFVDLRFDRAVRTRPMLQLHYASSSNEERYRDADTAQIAKVVPADAIVVMSMPDEGVVELDLLTGSPPERKALARVRSGPSGPTRGDIALAARALIDGKCMDLTTLPPVMLSCAEGSVVAEAPSDDGWPATRRPRGQFISGLTLLGVGSASLLTGYILLGPRARASEDWVNALVAGQGSASFQQKWFNMGVGIVVTSSAGAAVLVTAMPLALPKRTKTPWWAWLSGGLGVGFAAFSIAYGVNTEAEPDTSCSNLITDVTEARTCVKRGERITLAVLTGVTAAPLLTIPLVYLFRPTDTNITPTVEVSRSGGYVSVRGEF